MFMNLSILIWTSLLEYSEKWSIVISVKLSHCNSRTVCKSRQCFVIHSNSPYPDAPYPGTSVYRAPWALRNHVTRFKRGPRGEMSDATQTKTSPPRKRKRSAMTLDTKLKMVREIEKGCSLCSESVHVMYTYVQVFYSGYIKRYKYKCQCTLNHIYFEELWGCSKIRAFPSYGQWPVPSCPDKGSLSVSAIAASVIMVSSRYRRSRDGHRRDMTLMQSSPQLSQSFTVKFTTPSPGFTGISSSTASTSEGPIPLPTDSQQVTVTSESNKQCFRIARIPLCVILPHLWSPRNCKRCDSLATSIREWSVM